MYHLIYVSSAKKLFSNAQLRDLLEVSRRRNSECGITGLLLYVDGNFIQVLEGEKAAVLKTYGRVLKDSRHTGVTTVLQGEIAKREFAEWSMGFQRVDPESGAAIPGYSDFLAQKADPNHRPSITLRLLDYFKSINLEWGASSGVDGEA